MEYRDLQFNPEEPVIIIRGDLVKICGDADQAVVLEILGEARLYTMGETCRHCLDKMDEQDLLVWMSDEILIAQSAYMLTKDRLTSAIENLRKKGFVTSDRSHPQHKTVGYRVNVDAINDALAQAFPETSLVEYPRYRPYEDLADVCSCTDD